MIVAVKGNLPRQEMCHPHPTTTMKKTLLIFALAGAAAAQSPDYPVIYSAEAGGPVANPAYHPQAAAAAPAGPAAYRRPVVASRYAGNLLIGYGFLAVPDSKYATEVATCELEGAYRLSARQELTLSLGLAGGGETHDYWVREHGPHYHDSYPFTDSFDRLSFTVMAGYRFTQPITRRVSLQVGAKCGMDVQTLDVDYGYGWSGYPYDRYRDGKTDTAVGMAYAGFANLLFHVTPNSDLVVGYQFRGSTAKPAPKADGEGWPGAHTGALRWHEVHVGAMFRF